MKQWLRRYLGIDILPPEPPKPVPPFVAVLITADSEHGPTTMGTGHELVTHDHTIELNTHQRLTDVRIVVFADLRRVVIENVFCGVDLVHAGVGESPIAKFRQWLPGVIVRIPLRVRQ